MPEAASRDASSPVAVILDFDGVVVDSLESHLAAWRAATREVFRVDLPSEREFAALATRTIAGIIAQRYGDASLASVLSKAKWRFLAEANDPVPLLPGVAAFLAEARRLNLPLGIATNSPRAFVRSALARHGLAVETVVGSEDVARAKPKPDIYWECANRLDVHPRERQFVLVFEDSLHGIKGTLDAGMHAVGVATMHTQEELRRGGALKVVAHLADALGKGLLTSFA